MPVPWVEYIPVEEQFKISVGDLGIDDELKFKSLGQNDVIYAKGLISSKALNVDINKLKSLMNKD